MAWVALKRLRVGDEFVQAGELMPADYSPPQWARGAIVVQVADSMLKERGSTRRGRGASAPSSSDDE
jgi:hypothetical protein